MTGNQLHKQTILEFWSLFGGWKAKKTVAEYAPDFKLEHLLRMSRVIIQYDHQSHITKRRFTFNKVKAKLCRQKTGSPCFVCSQPGFARHHLIQLQNGGINSRRNLVIVCDSCHSKIHPWL